MADAPHRIAIVGAGSLRGKDLREALEQGSFAAADVRLFDEDIAVGTLTRAGDQPAVIAAVDEASFDGAGLVFFAGRAEMAERHAAQALAAGARVIDLSEDPGLEGAAAWIPALDASAGRPAAVAEGPVRSPSAPAILAASLAAGLGPLRPTRQVLVFLRPVSERGQEGIDELERQTVNLLSFRSFSQDVYGAQVAFNVLDAYGPDSRPSLDAVRRSIERDARAALGGRPCPGLAIQVLQAPVFYSCAFTAWFELEAAVEIPEIEAALASAGLLVAPAAGPRPTNMTVAGQTQASIASPVRVSGSQAGYWLWGAADNVRLVAANAVKIAEALD